MKIQGYAAYKAKDALKEFVYEPATLKPQDVAIKISHCGICHSDIHLIDNDWSVSKYPFIPGHEIVGEVTGRGSQVKDLKIGDRVGVGWESRSCHTCEWCQSGNENLCENNEATCVGRNGGYAERIIVDNQLAFPIPKEIDSPHAAPLMCAGVTVFSPLRRLGVNKNTKVGVVGIGGLGHLAIQFAKALGAEVTAFSTSPGKKAEAKKFGAHNFIIANRENLKKAHDTVDVLLSVVTVDLDWPLWLDVLRQNGKLVVLGASPSDMKVSPGTLLSRQKSIVGSNTGGIPMIKEMLVFAARHGIKPQIEVELLSNVNAALTKVRNNQARYRMVLEIDI